MKNYKTTYLDRHKFPQSFDRLQYQLPNPSFLFASTAPAPAFAKNRSSCCKSRPFLRYPVLAEVSHREIVEAELRLHSVERRQSCTAFIKIRFPLEGAEFHFHTCQSQVSVQYGYENCHLFEK